jgi:S-DNA-T family DNA segregation ATPase FtsK/SpoIIIE
VGLLALRGVAVTAFVLVLYLVPLAVLARGIWAVWRFARLPRQAKRHYPAALWARWRWRWLSHNLGLTYEDKHRRRRLVQRPFSTAVVVDGDRVGPITLRHPRARFRADAFGLMATVKTVPKVGRADFEKHAEHIANAWRCYRVQVSQPRPGRLIVRGLRTDPLTLPFGADEAPAGVFGSTSVLGGVIAPLRLYLGRDEWAADRWLNLPGLTGITIGGLPGYGKTSLVNSLLCQLAGLPVQFVFIDGKGGGDYADWQDRAWIWTGDELGDAVLALEDVHSLMRSRFGSVVEQTGHRNAWRVGPTEDFPLVVVVVDECHTFFDLDGVKGDSQAERHVRACRTLAGQLVKKGRSVLFLTVLITQKQTSDAIPTAIRDNCGFGVSFAVKTKDAAVASLGDQIREYPSSCPTTLQDPAYVGVCTAALRTGQDPFVRLRVPEITEEAAAQRAAETAGKRSDPSVLVRDPETVPA